MTILKAIPISICPGLKGSACVMLEIQNEIDWKTKNISDQRIEKIIFSNTVDCNIKLVALRFFYYREK